MRAVEGLDGDLRLAMRSLRGAPFVTFAALLSLAAGIGTTTAIFSVANSLLLRPLPVRDPATLVTMTSETALRFGFHGGAGWSYALWEQLRARAGAFDGAFAWTIDRVDLSDGGETQPANAWFASGGVFTTLGVAPLLGRVFTPADDVRGGGPDGAVAVISHDLWQRRFRGAPEAIGSRLPIEGAPFRIIGITPRGFTGVNVGQPFDVAIPLGLEPAVHGRRSIVESDRTFTLTVMVRLKPDQTRDEATAVLRALQPEILAASKGAPGFVKEPISLASAGTGIADRLRQQFGRPIVTLAVVSGLVLVIVCVNLALLLLARAAARRRELCIRIALGARRWHVARQLLVEGLVLGTLGAAGGLVIANWGSRSLVAQVPAGAAPLSLDVTTDWRVLAFTVALTVVAVLLCSTLPVLQATRVTPLDALQDDPRVAAGGRRQLLFGSLIVSQVAVSLVLVAAAGVFVQTLDRLGKVPLGFEPTNLIVAVIDTARTAADPADRLTFYQRVVDAVAAAPGVSSAAGSVWLPIGTGAGGVGADAGGRRPDVGPRVAYNFVTPAWFKTFGTSVREGREFDARDTAGAPRVAIVNEALRRRVLAERPAIGSVIDAGPCARGGCTVIGVAADAVYGRSLRDDPPPTVYVPLAQSAGLSLPRTTLHVSLRTTGPSSLALPALAAALRNVDSRLTYSFRPIESDIHAALAQERLVALLAWCFGAVALLLAAVGLYGVTAYSVTRRRPEIGIRLALGSRPATVVRLMLTRVALIVSAGSAIGVVASLWLSQFVAPLVYGIAPRDPVTLLSAVATLGVVGIAAAWIPARRAARLDPAEVLREN